MAYVYLIKSLISEKPWVYVGSTEDVEARVKQHNNGEVRSTQFRRPYELICVEEYGTIKEARFREQSLKKVRSLKEELVRKYIGPIV